MNQVGVGVVAALSVEARALGPSMPRDGVPPSSGLAVLPDGALLAVSGIGLVAAEAAARALVENSDLPARAIAEKSLRIAGQICIYTNDQITIEELHG